MNNKNQEIVLVSNWFTELIIWKYVYNESNLALFAWFLLNISMFTFLSLVWPQSSYLSIKKIRFLRFFHLLVCVFKLLSLSYHWMPFVFFTLSPKYIQFPFKSSEVLTLPITMLLIMIHSKCASYNVSPLRGKNKVNELHSHNWPQNLKICRPRVLAVNCADQILSFRYPIRFALCA